MPGSSHRVCRIALGIVAALGLISAAAPTALGANCSTCTWSGPSGDWSDGANWAGGKPPSSLVDSLTFPGNANFSLGGGSAASVDDIPGGVNTGSLTIDTTTSWDLEGHGVTIGSGGLQTTSSECRQPAPGQSWFWGPDVDVPITLETPQSWTMAFPLDYAVCGFITFAAPISGSYPLTVNVSGNAAMSVGQMNVGPLSFVGSGDRPWGLVTLQNEPYASPTGLNPGTGSPVSFKNGASLAVGDTNAASSGPLSMSDASMTLTNPMVFTVNGTFSLDSGSSYDVGIYAPGTTAGSDYAQLSASGNVNLGGAMLGLGFGQGLAGGQYGDNCPSLQIGDVDTLIKTSGSLIGTFANAPNGSTMQLYCAFGTGTEPTLRINYTKNSVTATVIGTTTTRSGSSTHGATLRLDKVRVRRRGAKVTVTCNGPAGSSCTDTLKLTVVETSRRGRVIAVAASKKTVVVRRLMVTLAAGQTKTVALWLNRTGRHFLALRRSFRAKLKIIQSGKIVATRTLRFKNKRRR